MNTDEHGLGAGYYSMAVSTDGLSTDEQRTHAERAPDASRRTGRAVQLHTVQFPAHGEAAHCSRKRMPASRRVVLYLLIR